MLRSTPEDWVADHLEVPDAATQALFVSLQPDDLRPALAAAGFPTVGSAHDFESMENRVYGYTTRRGERLVAKCYRPARWSEIALREEVAVWVALRQAGVAGLHCRTLADGDRLGTWRGMHFAVFDHVDGVEDRYDGWSETDLRQLGRLAADIHRVTEQLPIRHRLTMHPAAWTEGCLRVLEQTDALPAEEADRYLSSARELIAATEAALEDTPFLPVHGDLALNNVLCTPSGPVVMDFDDMSSGPAAQDLSLLHYGVNGAGLGTKESRTALRALFVAGYREVRPFEDAWIGLMEPLLALRVPWMDAWLASRRQEPLFEEDVAQGFTAEVIRSRAQRMEQALAGLTSGVQSPRQ